MDQAAEKRAYRPWSSIFGLLLCAAAYGSFHAIRPALWETLQTKDSSTTTLFLTYFHGSFPSFLLGAAMVISVGLLPTVRFTSEKSRVLILLAAVLLAGLWFEAIVPMWAPNSTGSGADVLAMLLGACLGILLTRSSLRVKNEEITDK